MAEKWTKEQIETAKEICKESCSSISCAECNLYKNDGCIISNAIGFCPTRLAIVNTEGYEEKLKSLIRQHEHDTDEPEIKTIPDKYETPVSTRQSVRDYWRYKFAGMAMQGMLNFYGNDNKNEDKYGICATFSVMYADALLERLEEKK